MIFNACFLPIHPYLPEKLINRGIKLMNNVCKYFRNILLGTIAVIILLVLSFLSYYGLQSKLNMNNAGPEAPLLQHADVEYRDLNKNNRLDIYEDKNRSTAERIDDLLSQMTVAEKAGLMFITMIAVGNDGELVERPVPSKLASLVSPINSEMVSVKLLNHFNVMDTPEPENLALWHNNIQKLAERTRLGIPITIATDPRHAFGFNPAASLPAEHFSLWPEPLGLAATRDTALVEEFANIARQEYLAVGLRSALHPMADLATEPRWSRIAGTFGEDADLSAEIVAAYVKGFQGDTLGKHSVATMVKHFSGGGPQKVGEDAHFAYGKEQVYPGNNFDYHIIPFENGAFPAKTAQIMPYYGIPVDQTDENVGFAFNKTIITEMLREKYGFDGVVCSDWGLINDTNILGFIPFLGVRAWGMEDSTPAQRVIKMLEAGIDQFGGEFVPELIVELVESNQITESRLDLSVARLLRDKFILGLFDNPYVDTAIAGDIVGNTAFRDAGALAQRKSLVLLKNSEDIDQNVLPLQSKTKIYIENINPEIAAQYGEVVDTASDADFAIIRISAPYEQREGLFESFFHAGDLDFKGEEKQRIIDLLGIVPTVVDIYLDRPAVIPDIAAKSVGLIANFGATDEALLDVVFGRFNPSGKLPFEMPSSMDAVRAQLEDVPYDSKDPLFAFGYGLSYQ